MIDTILANHSKIDIFCIGTPQVSGDALGPLVGSMLLQHNLDLRVNVVGTLGSPVTVTSYRRHLELLRSDSFILVVDATVGNRLWTYDLLLEPTNPGGALSTSIESIGDASVKAYTGRSIGHMTTADPWRVATLAHEITTRLVDLLNTTKIKGIYRDKNIYI